MMEAKSERGSSRGLALQAWPTLKRCDEGALLAGLEFVCIFGHDGDEPSVPSQKGFRCDDTGDFCQEFPAKRLTIYREPTSLVVCETKLPPAEPSFEDFVLLEQVDDSGLIVTLEPTSDGDDQQGQGLDRRAHDRGF